MMTPDVLPTARRVPRAQFDQALDCVQSARSEAARILGVAHAEAAEIRAAALAEARAVQADIEDREARLLEETAKAQEALQNAREAAGVLVQAARMQEAFAQTETWLVPLVGAALHRILGQMDAPELLAAQVGEAVSAMSAAKGLILRVAAVDAETLSQAMARHPDHFAAVSAVETDATLPAGVVHLEDKGGFMDISITTQIDVLCQQLNDMVPETVQ